MICSFQCPNFWDFPAIHVWGHHIVNQYIIKYHRIYIISHYSWVLSHEIIISLKYYDIPAIPWNSPNFIMKLSLKFARTCCRFCCHSPFNSSPAPCTSWVSPMWPHLGNPSSDGEELGHHRCGKPTVSLGQWSTNDGFCHEKSWKPCKHWGDHGQINANHLRSSVIFHGTLWNQQIRLSYSEWFCSQLYFCWFRWFSICKFPSFLLWLIWIHGVS